MDIALKPSQKKQKMADDAATESELAVDHARGFGPVCVCSALLFFVNVGFARPIRMLVSGAPCYPDIKNGIFKMGSPC